MSSEKKINANHASTSGVSSARPEITNNSQAKISSNHGVNSNISAALSEIAINSQTKANLSSTTRLTSFLAPRDLTLGANSIKADKPKRVYTPNLNAQRKKKEDEPATVQKNAKGPKNKHKGKGHDRGNKHKSNLIQSAGVFSEGLADAGSSRGRSSYGGHRESSDRSEPRETLQRPKLNVGRHVNKEEEEQKLKMLLRDDFVEDDNDVDYQNCPIVLPILKEGKLFKEESDVKIKIEGEEKVKTEVIKNNKKKPLEKGKFQIDTELDKKLALNVSQSLENKANGYFIFRFPDVLPGEPNEIEDDEARQNRNGESKVESENLKRGEPPLLNNLKEGLLGKLQILKSGAARLCLGEHKLVVELGARIFYREDVIAAKLDNEAQTGELINLGSALTNLVCTPNWESLTDC